MLRPSTARAFCSSSNRMSNVWSKYRGASDGYTLLELIITMSVLAVLVMGTVPMAQNAVKRDKEIRLREELRQMRAEIDEFKRDTFGACPQGSITTGNRTLPGGANAPTDPRSRVVIDDCTIFSTDNLDRYPPTLDRKST